MARILTAKGNVDGYDVRTWGPFQDGRTVDTHHLWLHLPGNDRQEFRLADEAIQKAAKALKAGTPVQLDVSLDTKKRLTVDAIHNGAATPTS